MNLKAQELRRLFAQPGIIQVAGAHNGLGARLVEGAGFEAIWASGLEISASYGVPDANILTMTEYLAATSSINEVTSLPVIADCDTGYGNSSNVIRLVKKYEAAGIAAICLEDKCFPKLNSFIAGNQELAPVAEFVGKILAAKNAQRSADFMVIARTEALIAGFGLDEAWRRAEAYANAGADALLIHSKANNPGEIEAFMAGWNQSRPVIVVPTSYPQVTIEELTAWGIKMVIYANAGIRAAVQAMTQVLQSLRQAGSLKAVEPALAPLSRIFELQQMTRFREDEKKYLRRSHDDFAVIIPAAGQTKSDDTLSQLLAERPVAMLDLNGKPLLQRNVECLRQQGLNNIVVVTGYKGDLINLEGITTVCNVEYQQSHILHSIMTAQHHFANQNLIIYSDILFEASIIQRLLAHPEDLVLVVDDSFANFTPANKNMDLVVAQAKPWAGKRRLLEHNHNQAVRIGQQTIRQEEADYEFIGIAKISESGSRALKSVYDDCAGRYRNRPFHEAPTFLQASFTDLLQEMIERGFPVTLMEVNSGWMEIQSFDDYRRACRLFSNGRPADHRNSGQHDNPLNLPVSQSSVIPWAEPRQCG
ncbi:MAG: phosphoenolpyruvate mutase [Deltaproteobacteria bacterium]|nr:MAG: phosphoenolpyruvate mutase [Deltaproteobacteria bacterium]